MGTLKSKLLNYLPKDKLLNCLGFLWPVINDSSGNNTKNILCVKHLNPVCKACLIQIFRFTF